MYALRTQVLKPKDKPLGSQDPEGRSSESVHMDLCGLGTCSLSRAPLNNAIRFEMSAPGDDMVEKEWHGLE